MEIQRKKDFGESKMMSIQFNGKTVGISFPSSFLRSKRRIPTERETNRGFESLFAFSRHLIFVEALPSLAS